MSEEDGTRGGYRTHEDDQLRSWAALTPTQRLEGLQQLKEFSFRYLGAASKKQKRALHLPEVVEHYRRHFQGPARAELESFRLEPTLAATVARAAWARTRRGERFPRQARLESPQLQRAAESLASRLEALERAADFAQLHELVEVAVRSIDGLGSRYSYDASLRIGFKRGLLPQRVYLRAGSLGGAAALQLPVDAKVLDRSDLPSDLRTLELWEVEDILRIYKGHFTGEIENVNDENACWSDDDPAE